MKNVVVVGEATAKSGQTEAIRVALKACAISSQAEAGNIVYQPYEEVDKSGTFFVYEVWKDEQAVDIHNESDHFKELISTVGPLCESVVIRIFRDI